MQLLTASKLSTVAMLAMAAVLYQTVSAVPMEQAGVEEVPTPKAPSLEDYKSTNGKPSKQAIKDLLAIRSVEKPLPTVIDSSSPVPKGAQNPLDMLPNETLANISKHMDRDSQKNFAQTNQRHHSVVNTELSRAADALQTKLDELWDKYKKENVAKGLPEWKEIQLSVLSPVWEKVVEEATDQKLIDCPYNELPYSPEERPEGQILSEEELLRMASRSSNVFQTYVRHNVCRLAINGAYPWLLRMLVMNEYDSRHEIFSVLGQLRMFTSDRAFASDLGKVLKLFTTIVKADNLWTSIPDDLDFLLMIVSPEIIPVMKGSRAAIATAPLLLLAVQQQQSGAVAHMKVAEKSLVDIAKVGSMDEFLHYLKPMMKEMDTLVLLLVTLTNQLVNFNVSLGKTNRQAINDLLKNPSSGFESDGKIIKPSRAYNEIAIYLEPFEMLVRLLSVDRLKAFYDDALKSEKNPGYIVMGGTVTGKSGFMKHVFEDIFGGEGTPIPGDLKVGDRRANARHLAILAQGCAIACTDENWKVFVEMFVKKIQSTPELPGIVYYRPSSAALSQEVAEHIGKCVKRTEYMKTLYREITPEDKNPVIQAQVDKVIARLQVLATTLSAPPAKSQLKRKGSPNEDEPVTKKTKY